MDGNIGDWTHIEVSNQQSLPFDQHLHGKGIPQKTSTDGHINRFFSQIDAFSTVHVGATGVQNGAVVNHNISRVENQNTIYTRVEYANILHQNILAILEIQAKLSDSGWSYDGDVGEITKEDDFGQSNGDVGTESYHDVRSHSLLQIALRLHQDLSTVSELLISPKPLEIPRSTSNPRHQQNKKRQSHRLFISAKAVTQWEKYTAAEGSYGWGEIRIDVVINNNNMQGQALRQRLSELKKASIELKSRVLNQPKFDVDSLAEILTTLLPAQPLSQSKLNHDARQTALAPSQLSTNSLSYSPASSLFVLPAQSKADRPVWHSRSSSNDSLPSKDGFDSEIQRLRVQNEELQVRLGNLSRQIGDLRKTEAIRGQESWKEGLPFVHRSEKVGVFLTRLAVREYDFDKIDYDSQQLQLINDRLVIQMPRSPKELRLASLHQVKYINDRHMRLELRSQEPVYLYLEFTSLTLRQSWDHAIYVNHRIITSKELDRSLFLEESTPPRSKSKASLRLLQDEKSEGKTDSKKMGSGKMPQRKIERSNGSNKQSYSSQFKKSQGSRSVNQLEYTLNGHSPDTLEPVNPNLQSSAVSADSRRSKELKDFMVFGEVGESNHESRANTSKFNVAELNFEAMEAPPATQQLKQQLKVAPIPPQKEELSKSQRALSQLKAGFFFVKYAKDGFRPHNKKLFLSNEEDVLICANSQNLHERKVIPIENIRSIKYGAMGEGINKHVKNPQADNHCLIEYTHQANSKVLQLGCQRGHFIRRFAEYLTHFLKKKGLLVHD